MNKIQKISLVGTLIAGTALCVALPLASCASTVESDYFYGRLGSATSTLRKYSFHNVYGIDSDVKGKESFVMKTDCGCDSGDIIYVSTDVMELYENWKGK